MGNRFSNKDRNQKDEINRLPVEIFEKVFSELSTLEHIRICCNTSSKWSQIISNMFYKDFSVFIRLEILMNLSPMSKCDQLKHVWNQEDCSHNLFIRHEDKFTVHRKTIIQSTDCIRGKVGYERGIHLFEITWPANLRGTHASVGVGTAEAPLHCTGYHTLVGQNEHSWGWDLGSIGRKMTYHNFIKNPGTTYPMLDPKMQNSSLKNCLRKFFQTNQQLYNEKKLIIPDKFLVILNMDQGTLGFVIDGIYLGHAFTDLKGKKLYLMVSAVWGNCKISMKYLAGLDPGMCYKDLLKDIPQSLRIIEKNGNVILAS